MTIFDRLENWLDEVVIKLKRLMNIITINGTRYEVQGKDINVRKSSVYVNGTQVVTDLSGTVKIEFQGDLANLDCTSAIINGNVRGDVDCTSAIITGDVGGSVDATTVKCGNVGGDVDGTTVTCGDVSGDVDALTVKRKK
jgi:hypothetical protein